MMKPVTKKSPCPICGKPDWCGVSEDGVYAVCMRVEVGSIQLSRNGGYVHLLKEREPGERRPKRRTLSAMINGQWNFPKLKPTQNIFRMAIDENRLTDLARQLGLLVDSLHRLEIGWCHCLNVWTFPMKAIDERIVGFRLRTPSGKKFSMTGGKEGLFIPWKLQFNHQQLFICEGPTDTAAMLDLGFDAIGRPSCLGAVELTAAFIREHCPLDVIIFSDADAPGRSGSAKLADALVGIARTVRIIEPPCKDVREWRRQGAAREDVLSLIHQTNPIQLKIHGVIA